MQEDTQPTENILRGAREEYADAHVAYLRADGELRDALERQRRGRPLPQSLQTLWKTFIQATKRRKIARQYLDKLNEQSK